MVDGPKPRRIGHSLFVAGAGLLTGLFGWVATSPRLLVHINWDAGSYLHQIASGSVRWSNAPWSSHFGMQYACGFVLLVEVGLLGAATAWSYRRRCWGPHLFATSLLVFSVLTALYRDVAYAYLKRTNFVPLLLVGTAGPLHHRESGRDGHMAPKNARAGYAIRPQGSLRCEWISPAAQRTLAPVTRP